MCAHTKIKSIGEVGVATPMRSEKVWALRYLCAEPNFFVP